MRNYIRKSNRQSWSRHAMASAIAACLSGSVGYLKASKIFSVPRSTLKNRISRAKCGKSITEAARNKFGGYNTVFTTEQEKELMAYVLELEPELYELTPLKLRKIAYHFAQEKGVKHNFNNNTGTAGLDWLRGFVTRHPDISFFITRTSKMPKWSKSAIALLIDLYKENSCLYDIGSFHYHDEQERKKALENIAKQLQETRPGTTDTEVKTKLECLRSAYLSVEKKMEELLNDGNDTAEMYTPSIWYYDKLSFLASYIESHKNNPAMVVSEICKSYQGEMQMEPVAIEDIKTEEAEINIECVNGAIEDPTNTSAALVFTQVDAPYLVELPSANLISSAAQHTQPRPLFPKQYPSSKRKRAVENDPLEIPPADGLKPSEATSTPMSESIDQFISYIGARMKRIYNKDILQELEDDILLKVMQAEKDDRKRQRE